MTLLPTKTPFEILPLSDLGKNDLCDYHHKRDYTGENVRLFGRIDNGDKSAVHAAISHAFNAGRQVMFDSLIDHLLELCEDLDGVVSDRFYTGEYDGDTIEGVARQIEFIRTGRMPPDNRRDWNKGPVPSDILKAYESFLNWAKPGCPSGDYDA